MVNVDRINSIVFDLKQSVEDLGNELKLMIIDSQNLNQRIRVLEEKYELEQE